MLLLVLPHQLYEYKYIPKDVSEVIIYEHPHYFSDYNYNQKKILLHKGSMEYYRDYLKDRNFKVVYVTYDRKLKISNKEEGYYFDPIDKIDGLPKGFKMLESPNFLLNLEDYAQYRKKTDKFMFNAFYMWGKGVIDVIPKVKSTDKENRNAMPAGVKIPKIPSNKSDKKYINIGAKYASRNFSKNIGNVDNFVYPLTHKTAKKFLKSFIAKKLNNFGKYQDAIVEGESYLFHSVLSSSLNIGLLSPIDVIDAVLSKRSKSGMNNIEGFIRQLFWREWQRYTYIYINNWGKTNYFGNRKKLDDLWYGIGNKSVGIPIIDDCIKKGLDTAYLHHIERLMVIGNYMNLVGIHPKEGHEWFMSFSIDAYEWVMGSNVYDMVFFSDGRRSTTRPYVSSSNYILKMSNYPRGSWCDEWDDLYENFIKRNKSKLKKFRYYFRGKV